MLYKFKKETYEKLMDGRKCEWLADEIGYNNCTLSLIFNGHKLCKKALALAIVKTMNNDYTVEEFFEKIDTSEGV